MTAIAKLKVKVPLIIGTNLNETSLFQCALKEDIGADEAAREISRLAAHLTGFNLTAAEAHRVLDQYPVGPGAFPSPRSAVIGASTDIIFGCPTRRVTGAVQPSAYRYVLGRSPLFFRFDKCFGVPHTADTFYVFYNNITGRAMDKGDKTVASAMMSSWFAFARGEKPTFPSGFGSQPWPMWSNAAQSFWFAEAPHIESGFHTAACNIVDEVVFRVPHIASR